MEAVLVVGAGLWIWQARVGASVVLTLAVFLFADVFRTFEIAMFGASRRQRPAALASASEALLKPLLVVAGVFLFGARIEVVLGAIASSMVVTLVGVYITARLDNLGPGVALPSQIATEMRRYALPLIPIALLNWLTGVSDRYIIQWLSHDLPSVGLYAAGYGLISQPFLILHGVAALTLRPVYFSAVSRNDQSHAAKTFRAWLVLSSSICVVATALIFVWRGSLVSTFLGPQYRGAVVVVPWIALGYLFYVIEQVLEQHLLAHKRTRAVLYTQAGGAAASVIVTVPLVASQGMVGAAYACPIYFLIQCLIAASLVWRASPQGPGLPAENALPSSARDANL
jgi:O-antigen/teichoic acid export membrane protein